MQKCSKTLLKLAYAQACDSRDAYISEDEVDRAVQNSIESLDTNNVNHFWKDGIIRDDDAQRDIVETQRRIFLIAFAEVKRSKGKVTKQNLEGSDRIKNSVAVDEMIESFISRGILLEEGDGYRLKPRFFERWLVERGGQLITSTFLDDEAVTALKNKESEAYVNDSELKKLCDRWGYYRVSPAHIRSWLGQFADNIERRLMFRLLENLRFYNETIVMEKLQIIHQSACKGLIDRRQDRRESRRDILLSSFGEPSKSGSSYARKYAQANKITVHNVAHLDRIAEALDRNDAIAALVFVDDIIASGSTVIEHLRDLDRRIGDILAEKSVKVVISAVCGLSSGVEKLMGEAGKMRFKLETEVADILTAEDQCFSEQSKVFESPADREMAKRIALEYGKKLQSRQPLGFSDGQLLVVFHDNCPNNTLPILWASSTRNFEWEPLFGRI